MSLISGVDLMLAQGPPVCDLPSQGLSISVTFHYISACMSIIVSSYNELFSVIHLFEYIIMISHKAFVINVHV